MPPKKGKKERKNKMPKGKIATALMGLLEGDNMKDAVNDAFTKLDKNESGFLEKDELFEALNEMLGAEGDEKGISEKQFDKFFGNVDKDGDGKLSKDEFSKRAKRLFKKMQEAGDDDDDDDE